MKILVIGGCGYIGSRLCHELREMEVDSIDLEWYGNFYTKNIKKDVKELTVEDISKYDSVVAIYGQSSEKMCEGDFQGVFKNNVSNLVHLSEIIRLSNRPIQLIYASSCRVYYGSKLFVSMEDDVNFTSKHPYDISKYMCDLVMQNYDIEYYGLRFGTVNGWSYNFRRESLINSMALSCRDRGYLEISNGHIGRAVLDMDDLVRAIRQILYFGEKEKRGVYNINSFNGTVSEIGRSVGEYFHCPVRDNGNTTNLPLSFEMNPFKFCEIFNFKFNGSVHSIIDSIMCNYSKFTLTDRNNRVEYI